MKRSIGIFILLAAAAVLHSCSTTRSLRDGEYLLRKNTVQVDSRDFSAASLGAYVVQKPNSYLLGLNPFLSVYNWSGQDPSAAGGLYRKLGVAPVVYDPSKVDESIESMLGHLRYIGYYGSQVESQVQVKGRKVYVNYYVTLGKRYTVSDIRYEIPQYGTFAQDFGRDLPNTTLKKGLFLSEEALDKEADRSASYLRTLGYYGFNKNFYTFEADTLSGNGQAKLKVSIRDYARGDRPESAAQHRKFSLGDVTITYPERLKIRPSVLEGLNLLRPGMPYDERTVNATYSRLSSVGMFSGVNVTMTPVSEDRVDCNIGLRNSRLQGIKANLEASVNSTGLFGLSPQLNYYHRNLFHGGELLNVGLKGNFQFKPGAADAAYTTEVSATSTLRFPLFLGLPNSIFKGANVPRTDLSASFIYQDRPEFKRTVIATSYAYSGRIGSRLLYQFTPFRANVARLFNIEEDFMLRLMETNPFLLLAYMDHFDMGMSGSLYYTTDASTIPVTPYHYFRLSVDVSGNALSLLNNVMPVDDYGAHTIWETPYSQYVRSELHMGKVFRFGHEDRQALALHLMGGIGRAYGNSTSLPIERYFYAGGSNSMRGWQARTIGPGNEETNMLFAIPTQMGDMKLEANVEYRFPLVWKLEGALFVDAGNIWDIRMPDSEYEAGGYFDWKTLPESIGLDWGLGIRVNLDFLLVRLDGGIRLHDPSRTAGDRWVSPGQWFKGNYAIHFGVGYPF